MPLDPQVVSLPFAQGQDSRTDPKQIPAPKLLLLQDADFESPGQLVQPPGSIGLSLNRLDAGTLSSADDPNSAYESNGQLILRGKEELFAYSEKESKWSPIISPNPLEYSKKTIYAGILYSNNIGYAENTDFICFAVCVSNNVSGSQLEISVVEKKSGLLRFSQQFSILSTVTSSCVVLGNTLVVYSAYLGASNSILAKVIDLTTMTLTSSFSRGVPGVVSEMSVVAMSWKNSIVLMWRDVASNVYLAEDTIPLGSGFTISAVGPISSAKRSPYVSVKQGTTLADDRVFAFFVVGASTGSPTVKVYDGVLSSVSSNVALGVSLTWSKALFDAAVLGGLMKVYFSQKDPQPLSSDDPLLVATISDSGVVTNITTNVTGRSNKPAVEPFDFLGKRFLIVTDPIDLKYALYSESGGSTQNGSMPEAYFGTGELGPIDRSIVISETSFSFAGLELVRDLGNGSGEYRLTRYQFFYSSLNFGSSIKLGNTMYLPGPQPLCYDGRFLVEAGFNQSPKGDATLGSPGNNTAGTHLYTAIYQWFDSNGNIQRSVPMTPISLVSAGSDLFVWDFDGIGASRKGPVVTCSLYKTISNGTVFYLVGSCSISPSQTSVGAINDSISDSDLQKNEQIYTTGGVLEDASWPSCSFMHLHQKRPLLISSEDGNKVFIGKSIEDKFAPAFNEDIFKRFDKGDGGLLAIASLDEKWIAFKSKLFFAVVGDGPNDLGVDSTYSDPQEIQSDTGITEPRSILGCSIGVIYKTVRGWYLLDRKLNSVFIGGDVLRFNSSVVTGSLLVASRNQARFFHKDGTTLIFDYLNSQWSVRTNQSAQGACLWKGKQVYVDPDCQALYQDSSQWLEGGSLVEPKFTTSWMALGQIQGFQRIYRAQFFGELRSRHTIRIRVGFDYDPAWKDVFEMDSTDAQIVDQLTDASYFQSIEELGGIPKPNLKYEVRPYIQLCEAIRFEITILNTEGTNLELARISGMALVVGVKRGTKRLNAERIIA